jgi:hypothetical protein
VPIVMAPDSAMASRILTLNFEKLPNKPEFHQ